MSIRNTRASPKSPTVSEQSLTISDHARLRFLERVDATAINPAERIREIVADGDWTRLSNFSNPAKMLDGVAVVVDRTVGEAITVVVPRRHQLVSDTDASAGWRDEYEFQGVGGDAR